MKATQHEADMTNRAIRDAGFTLIETIVSIALLSLMLTIIPPAVRLSREAWLFEPQLERSAAVASTRKVISRYLENVVPLRARGASSGARHVGFDGRPDRVFFVAMAAEPHVSGGLRTFMLALEPAVADQRRGSRALVLGQGPFSADEMILDSGLGPDASRSLLIDDVVALKFRYFGPASDSERQSVWQDSWMQRNTFPTLIEITFEPRNPIRRRGSEVLVVKPQINRLN